MEQFLGQYQIESTENIDEYFKAKGSFAVAYRPPSFASFVAVVAGILLPSSYRPRSWMTEPPLQESRGSCER
jgi:hypothetical protein